MEKYERDQMFNDPPEDQIPGKKATIIICVGLFIVSAIAFVANYS